MSSKDREPLEPIQPMNDRTYGQFESQTGSDALASDRVERAYRSVADIRLKADKDEYKLPELAAALDQLSTELADVGRWTEALEVANECLQLYQQLAVQQPTSFLTELAAAHNNLSARLNALGRIEEALESASKAVVIYRQLAAQDPVHFVPDLASALNNLGNRLSRLGRREEALLAAKEAFSILRQLIGQDAEAYLPNLASSLNNLGMMLSEARQSDEALQATQEAVSVYRQLIAANPEAFLPNLASSLNNLGTTLSEMGRREEALSSTEEAVTIRRQLAATRPSAFLQDLASSLNNLGTMQSELGRREYALRALEEAVSIYRNLAAMNREAFLPDLAASLNNLGTMQTDVGELERALHSTEEAISIYSNLATQNPDAFLYSLATTQAAKASVLLRLGKAVDATALLREALASAKHNLARGSEAIRQLVTGLAMRYVRTAEAAGVEPESDLLADLLPQFRGRTESKDIDTALTPYSLSANPQQVDKLRQGARAWNQWRWSQPLILPDLSRADLRRTDLSLADLSGAYIARADLSDANLHGVDLSGANLMGANLSRSNLRGATLAGANLSGADLSNSNLEGVNLFRTTFADTNLSRVYGLANCNHTGPSFLDFQTLANSGPLPEDFLRGCGLPDRFIEYLPAMFNQPIDFYSCFISYSTRDRDFVDRLHADLQNKGVRCWFAPQDLQSGRKLHEQVDEAIRLYDRLLLVLSANSMNSEWVKQEIVHARKKELSQSRQVLFPISIVPFSELRQWELFDANTGKDAAKEIHEYFIPDFSNWKSHDAYQHAFDRLLKGLKAEPA